MQVKIESLPGGVLRMLGGGAGRWKIMATLVDPATVPGTTWHGFLAPENPILGDLFVDIENKLHIWTAEGWVLVK